jgi:hypothetical protein
VWSLDAVGVGRVRARASGEMQEAE